MARLRYCPMLQEGSDSKGWHWQQSRVTLASFSAEITVVSLRGMRYVGAHWRGELSLAKSFWINGLLIGTLFDILRIPPGFVTVSDPQVAAALGVLAIVLLLADVALFLWQAVGIWRSAGRHMMTTERKGWGVAARGALILYAIFSYAPFPIPES